MITIQKNEFEFEAENEVFVRTLYGQWDTFHRTCFEQVVDEVLSRYDTPDELIRIEALHLDLGTLTEAEFYEQFPRRLAQQLDETFAAFLARKDTHPGDIKIIPIKQSLLDQFSLYLLKGYLPWEEESRRWNLSDLVEEIIRSDAGGLLRLLQAEGGKTSVRERLVFQFPDADLQRLTEIIVPSDAPFINAYAGFLIDSHRRLQRPNLTLRDFRDGVWLVIWAYLLAESKGYYSRKQLVGYTLQGLSARYAIPLDTLLDWMTAGLEEWGAVRLAVPELLVILSEIREEHKADSTEAAAIRSTSKVWIALLSVADSCRRFLRNLREEQIYAYVRVVIPSEEVFVIRYAQTLDKEKERGMLEGKAGDEFRLLKWEFIFQVILHTPAGSYARLQFAYAVLERLAAHYNLEVMELLSYFYRSLVAGEVQADSSIRELIYALFLEHRRLLGGGRLTLFPTDLKETLANIHLCRLFLRPLPEEKIYLIVEEIIPGESPFIIQYARLLDKGKDQQALEGKAGEEFRILKWEFIFLVLLGAPRSDFNRKQFTRSVLQQLAAHYNLTVKDLIVFFYENLTVGDWEVPVSIREVITFLYEEIGKESPETRLMQRLETETQRCRLEELIRKGRIVTFPHLTSLDSLYEFVKEMSRTQPSALLKIIESLREESLEEVEVKPVDSGGVFAWLLHWVICSYGLSFSRREALLKRLEEIETRRRTADGSLLRLLLYHCIRNRMDAFQKVLDEFLRSAGDSPTLETRRSLLEGITEDQGRRPQPTEIKRGSEESIIDLLRVPDRMETFLLSPSSSPSSSSPPSSPSLSSPSSSSLSSSSPSLSSPTEATSVKPSVVKQRSEDVVSEEVHPGEVIPGEFVTSAEMTSAKIGSGKMRSVEIRSEKIVAGKNVAESKSTVSASVKKAALDVLTPKEWPESISSSELVPAVVSETMIPETIIRETIISETVVPEAIIPETIIPETVVSETIIPEAVTLSGGTPATSAPVTSTVITSTAAAPTPTTSTPASFPAATGIASVGISVTGASEAVPAKEVTPSAPSTAEKLPLASPQGEAISAGTYPIPPKPAPEKTSDQISDRKETALAFPYRWLSEHASASLRTVIEEVLYILSSVKISIRESDWLPLLIDLASSSYHYYSRTALWELFWDRLKEKLVADDRTLLLQTLRTHHQAAPGWGEVLEKDGYSILSPSDHAQPVSVYVRNAGLVLLAPFFPRLFGLLNLLDEKKTLSVRAHQIKAIYMIQYLVTADEILPEYELFLNKLLTGYEPGESFPSFLKIEEADLQILLSLLNGVRQNWSKMKNTSIQGFRTSFLLRDGVLEEQDDKWLLMVDPRAYDVLLDTLPWSYSPIKFPWMMKPLYVKWL